MSNSGSKTGFKFSAAFKYAPVYVPLSSKLYSHCLVFSEYSWTLTGSSKSTSGIIIVAIKGNSAGKMASSQLASISHSEIYKTSIVVASDSELV